MKMQSKPKIGFIGLGLMGKPMARNLLNAGAQVVVFNRTASVVNSLVPEGFIPASSPAQVAQECSIAICMVSNTAAVEEVIFGPSGMIEGAQENSLIIDMGTTEVGVTRDIAERLQQSGVRFIDAPVSGGEIGAQTATLSIMVGASEDDLSHVESILQVLGSTIIHVGDIGSGQIAKAANQIIVGLTIQAVAEALALAQKGGADMKKVREALLGGFATSRVLDLHGQRMIESNFKPGGTSITQRKDLYQALTFANQIGIELPATQQCLQRYDELIQLGRGNLDHSALYTLF